MDTITILSDLVQMLVAYHANPQGHASYSQELEAAQEHLECYPQGIAPKISLELPDGDKRNIQIWHSSQHDDGCWNYCVSIENARQSPPFTPWMKMFKEKHECLRLIANTVGLRPEETPGHRALIDALVKHFRERVTAKQNPEPPETLPYLVRGILEEFGSSGETEMERLESFMADARLTIIKQRQNPNMPPIRLGWKPQMDQYLRCQSCYRLHDVLVEKCEACSGNLTLIDQATLDAEEQNKAQAFRHIIDNPPTY